MPKQANMVTPQDLYSLQHKQGARAVYSLERKGMKSQKNKDLNFTINESFTEQAQQPSGSQDAKRHNTAMTNYQTRAPDHAAINPQNRFSIINKLINDGNKDF